MGLPVLDRIVEWFKCETCGERVHEIHNNSCKFCATIAYLKFRHAFNWPLTAEDKARLGLI